MNGNYHLPSSDGVLIPGKRGRIFAQLYLPEGEYPAPVVVLCHGIPGNERLLDFAVALREAGFCSLHFHYSGSWGSDGDYSMLHCFEDTLTVIDWVGKNEPGCFDTDRVFVLGHSMGGIMACRAIGCSDLIKGGVVIMPLNGAVPIDEALSGSPSKEQTDFYDGCGKWLKNFGWKTMAEDAMTAPEQFRFETYAKAMAGKPVLTVAGAKDFLLPREGHLDILNGLIEKEGKGLLKSLTFDCDHGMNMHRSEIKAAVSGFLKDLC
ncbi:MAG: alpha/beta fold hydrolase [Firmicutes bacterium]|nr:alpha/beta fold hydrolase [Bacillota bacterium]